MNNFFSSGEREYDAAMACGVGWFRGLNREGAFLGYIFVCPGSLQKATIAAPRGYKDADGNFVDEVPIVRPAGCGFSSYPIPPGLDGPQAVGVTCPQCRQTSRLTEWMRRNAIKRLEDIPARPVAPAYSLPPIIAVDGADVDYSYTRSDPGKAGLF